MKTTKHDWPSNEDDYEQLAQAVITGIVGSAAFVTLFVAVIYAIVNY